MILVQDLRDRLASALDAEGSDYYTNDLDYIPAINSAMKWVTTLVNIAYGQNKIGEEFFRELTYSGVFKTNNNSRVSLNSFPSEVWSILAIYINPITEIDDSLPVPLTPDNKKSYYLSNLIHVSSELDCKRLSLEEWARNKKNPFESGYDGNELCDDLKLYSYLSPINYTSSGDITYAQQLEVRPSVINESLTIFWVKKPDEIVLITDSIDFPNSLFQLLLNKALVYLSYKQGDNTNLFSISTADINQLLTAL